MELQRQSELRKREFLEMEEVRAWGLVLQSARRGRKGLAWAEELLRQSGLRKREFLAME